MRHFLRGEESRRVRLKFCREALVWKDLRHPYILSFIGIDRDNFPPSLCMVSPWMEHSTVLNYLKEHGYAHVNRLLFKIAQGLEYLHSHNIVHSDLRGSNILINDDWSACLADFDAHFKSRRQQHLLDGARVNQLGALWTPIFSHTSKRHICLRLCLPRVVHMQTTVFRAAKCCKMPLCSASWGGRPRRPAGPPQCQMHFGSVLRPTGQEIPQLRGHVSRSSSLMSLYLATSESGCIYNFTVHALHAACITHFRNFPGAGSRTGIFNPAVVHLQSLQMIRRLAFKERFPKLLKTTDGGELAYTASYFDIGGSSFTPSGSSKIGGVVRQGEVSVKEDGMFATWI
ncbi:kinase-like domain-containing protein [Mycena galericulata]|nr:kinase-like domain-containing protein [Mycena galericulata]